MPTGIRGVIRGFWQAAKKLGRASLIAPNDIRRKSQEGIDPRNSQEEPGTLQEATARLEALSEALREQSVDSPVTRLHICKCYLD